MEPKFITYRKFNDMALAMDLVSFLQEHNIQHAIEEESLSINPTMILNDELAKEYVIKINNTDFDLVDKLMLQAESNNEEELEKDYYLFNFSSDELMELLSKADEWSPFDVFHARKILEERGVKVSDQRLSELKEKRIAELKKPEQPQTSWIIIGYMCSLLGGILGIFIGWHLFTYKKTLPNGEKAFEYSENDRKHGKRIFYLSTIIFALLFIAKITGIIFGNTN